MQTLAIPATTTQANPAANPETLSVSGRAADSAAPADFGSLLAKGLLAEAATGQAAVAARPDAARPRPAGETKDERQNPVAGDGNPLANVILALPVNAPQEMQAADHNSATPAQPLRVTMQGGAGPGRMPSAEAEPIESRMETAPEKNPAASPVPAMPAAAPEPGLRSEAGKHAEQNLSTPLTGQPTPAPGAIAEAPAAVPVKHVPVVTLDIPVAAQGWQVAFAQKVVWLANDEHQVAHLQLNPPHLGPVEIILTLSGDNASASFVAQHAPVREAIESALPRLKEMLAETGISLGSVTVSADSFPGQSGGEHKARPALRPMGFPAQDVSVPAVSGVARAGPAREGLVDTFA